MRPPLHSAVLEHRPLDDTPERVSNELDGWLRAEPNPTLGDSRTRCCR